MYTFIDPSSRSYRSQSACPNVDLIPFAVLCGQSSLIVLRPSLMVSACRCANSCSELGSPWLVERTRVRPTEFASSWVWRVASIARAEVRKVESEKLLKAASKSWGGVGIVPMTSNGD